MRVPLSDSSGEIAKDNIEENDDIEELAFLVRNILVGIPCVLTETRHERHRRCWVIYVAFKIQHIDRRTICITQRIE